MTINPTYPGVYVSEVGSGNRTIVGVSTAITAFVGRALRGPVDEPVAIGSFADFVRQFGPIWRESGLGYAVNDFYLNGGGPAIIVRIAKNATAATLDQGSLHLTALGPGTWANDLTVDVTYPSTADAQVVATGQGLADPDALFSLTLRLGGVVETHRNLTIVDGPRRIDRVLASSQLVRFDGAPAGPRPAEATGTALTPGVDGDPPGASEYFAPGARTGIGALDASDLVNIVVLPPPTPATDVPESVWAQAMAYARSRRAFLIIDPPQTKTGEQVKPWTADAGLAGEDASYAAVYYPRIKTADPLSEGAAMEFPASGALAGLFARTDASRGVWKAPAGIEAGIAGAVGLTAKLTDTENGALNPLGVNAIRTFRDPGTVVWGARTLRGADSLADDYKYIPIRRLALYIEESLYRGTQWVVFEPNDEPLWAQIRLSVGGFMQDLFRRGAFQGASARQAYFVRCDADTTTQYDIDRGIVNIEVGFAPLKPAEFVMITIQQKTAGQE